MTEHELNAGLGVKTSQAVMAFPPELGEMTALWWGIMALCYHVSSVSWKVKLTALTMIMLFRDAGGLHIPEC